MYVQGLVGPVLRCAIVAAAAILAQVRPAVGQDALVAQAPERPLDGRGVPLGCDLIEGDIIICGDPDCRATYVTNLWASGIVPYEFDANVSALNRQRTVDAVAEWAAVADLSFEPYNPAVHGFNHIHVRDSSGDEQPSNSSLVGMAGGEQVINIASWGAKFVIAHEFGHALGYWHEQSRPDRDTYVRIEWDRIEEGTEHNFNLHADAGQYGPYDFDSVMHYGQCAFSCCGAQPPLACTTTSCGADLPNCRTITVLPPHQSFQDDIGQRNQLSFWDAQVMSFLYPEDDWWFVGIPDSGSGNGTFASPWTSLSSAYALWAPAGATLWVLEPGEWIVGQDLLDRPMTIRSANGIVTLRP